MSAVDYKQAQAEAASKAKEDAKSNKERTDEIRAGECAIVKPEDGMN